MAMCFQCGRAGTNKKTDMVVEVKLGEEISGIRIDLVSKVEKKYGDSIRRTVRDVLAQLAVDCAEVGISDMGALDFVIRARVETAVLRARKEEMS